MSRIDPPGAPLLQQIQLGPTMPRDVQSNQMQPRPTSSYKYVLPATAFVPSLHSDYFKYAGSIAQIDTAALPVGTVFPFTGNYLSSIIQPPGIQLREISFEVQRSTAADVLTCFVQQVDPSGTDTQVAQVSSTNHGVWETLKYDPGATPLTIRDGYSYYLQVHMEAGQGTSSPLFRRASIMLTRISLDNV